MEQLRLFTGLVWRGDGAAAVLERGRWRVAVLAVALACAIAALNVRRFAGSVSIESLAYGPERSDLVRVLLDTIGTARTAVLVYFAEQAWTSVLVVSAAAPLLVWLLGATAVHAAAAMADARSRFGRFFVFFGYATASALVPSGLVSLALEGEPRSPAAVLGRVLGLALLVWLAATAYRGIRAYYGVGSARARTILAIAIGLFYLVPLALIIVAVAALVAAAMALQLA